MKNIKKLRINILSIFLFLSFLITVNKNLLAETEIIRPIFFPTDPSLTFTDSFGDPRSGHYHEAIDIIGDKMAPLYAAVDGIVSYIVIPEAEWGYAVEIKDAEGYTYHYLHMNNDTPGTDDGQGGPENVYADGIVRGAEVTKGQLIGWMGDSGNAEDVGSHLHFEIRLPDDTAINPYASLLSALQPGNYDRIKVMENTMDINTDKSLVEGTNLAVCTSGSLIKLENMQAVYYCGADGKRYVFPNDKVYFSWYSDFSDVDILTAEEMASIPLGGNVTYRPGFRMVKIQTNPKVYAVSRGGELRWVQSSANAELLYGPEWNTMVDDVPDTFFMDYIIGEPIF